MATSADASDAITVNGVTAQICSEMRALSQQDRLLEMQRRVVMVAASITSDPPSSIDVTVPVNDIGLSSMGIVDLTSQLSATVGPNLSPTMMYESVNLCGIAKVSFFLQFYLN